MIILFQEQEWNVIHTLMIFQEGRSVGEITFDTNNRGSENKYEGRKKSFREEEEKLKKTIKIEYTALALYIFIYTIIRFVLIIIKPHFKEADNILYSTLIVVTIGDILLGIILTVRFIKIIGFMKKKANMEYRIHAKSMALIYACLIFYLLSRLYDYLLYFAIFYDSQKDLWEKDNKEFSNLDFKDLCEHDWHFR
jgi:hypothetical protein